MPRGNRPPEKIIEAIFLAMKKHKKPVSIHAISQNAGVDYKTARRYIPLIVAIQKHPKIVSSAGGVLYSIRPVRTPT